MAMKQDGPYDTRTLTQIFAWSSIALLAATVWMVIEDHDREWKDTQEAYREIEIAKRKAELSAALRDRNSLLQIELKDKRIVEGRFQDLGDRLVFDDGETRQEFPRESIVRMTPLLTAREGALEEARKAREDAGQQIEKLQRKYFKELGKYQKADLSYKNRKSEMESYVYEYEHAVQERSAKRDDKLKKLNAARAEVAELLTKRDHIELYADHGRRASDPKLSSDEVVSAEKSPRGVQGRYAKLDGGKLYIADKAPLKISESAQAQIASFLETVPRGRPITAILNGEKEVETVAAVIAGTTGLNDALSALRLDYTEASKALDALQSEVNRLSGNLEKVDRNFVNDWFRNQPLADFIDPSLEAKQIVIENIKDDYFFAQIRKVDRCETCHLAIDKKNFTGMLVEIQGEGMVTVLSAETSQDGKSKLLTFHDGSTRNLPLTSIVGEPKAIPSHFQSHPKLDVFLSSSSPHPKLEFGCTVCHQGEGRSMEFTFAAHTPSDDQELDRWEKEQHWHKRHHWDYPQVRTQYLESSCLLCHANNRPVENAPKLNFGREVWERVGCYGCHKMKGYIEEPKRGPDLRRMKDKLTPEWVFHWLENPANYRPKTNMPRFWFASGEAPAEGADVDEHVLQQKRDQAEIVAVTRYLFEMSDPYDAVKEVSDDPAKPELGQALFEERGCLGCHKLDEKESLGDPRGYTPNEYGPNLAHIGDKLSFPWMVAWLKNPQHYWADTRMPDLQLTDDEARNIAAFLTARKGAKGIPKALPKVDGDVLKGLVKNFLSKDMTDVQVAQAFQGASGTHQSFPEMAESLNLSETEDQLLYLGRQMVTAYGCFGCHMVKGMETRPGIGAELSSIGDKDLHKVDWGHTTKDRKKRGQENYLPHQREDWLQYKVKNPRFTDEGRLKSLGYLDRARMPRFNMTDAEREALATFLSGHSERQVPKEYKYAPDARKQKEIEGSYQIYRKNCKACHVFEPDTIVLERPKLVEDEVDGDIEVNGKSIDDWAEILGDEDSGEANRLAAVDALSDARANAVVRLREVLGELEVTAENQRLRTALARGIGKINSALGMERVTVKGLVMLDNRYQADSYGRPLVDSSGRPRPFPLNDEDDEPIKGAENEPAPSWGQAIIQLWEDGADKEAGATVAVADHPWADPSVYFSRIVSINSPKVGAETEIPESLRRRFPNDFRAANAAGSQSPGLASRRRGGAAFQSLLWPRAQAKLGRDPRVHSGDVDITGVANVAAAIFEAQTYGPPHLRNEGSKVQTLWLRSFLLDPSARIRPWLNIRMPNYGLEGPEAAALADYFEAHEEKRLEGLLAKATKRLSALKGKMAKAPEDFKEKAQVDKAVSEALDPIQARGYFNIATGAGSLDFGVKRSATIQAVPDETTDAFRAERESAHPYWYSKGYELFLKAECLSCHIWEGRMPGQKDAASWGPDLTRVRNRIRPQWFQDWVDNPKAIVPGTKMSQQFGSGKYPEYFGGQPREQIEVLKDFVYGGMKPALEAFPVELANGGVVRISSQLLSLDNYDKVYVRTPDGDVREYSLAAKNLIAEKSAGRTVAFALTLEGKPGTYLISTSKRDKDGKVPTGTDTGGVIIFHGRVEVTVK